VGIGSISKIDPQGTGEKALVTVNIREHSRRVQGKTARSGGTCDSLALTENSRSRL
jgi:hypothetical protein